MANYQTLKAAINAVIKANGNKEITGTVLNETLLAIVNSLGVGYQFVGVATPSTNPGTPDQNVFYIAGQAGTYTNFNSIALPDGVSILKWNGSWSGETVVAGDGVFDISAYKATGGTLATFADLSAALDGGNNIPQSLRNGGMSVKFVQSSDNKYVQYRCVANEFTTNTNKWAICDEGVYIENPEWLKVVTDKDGKILYGTKIDGNFYFGNDCPPQVKEYVRLQIKNIGLDALLDMKVDKVSGKSLINSDFADSQDVIESLEWLKVVIDNGGRIVDGIRKDGVRIISTPIEEFRLTGNGISILKDILNEQGYSSDAITQEEADIRYAEKSIEENVAANTNELDGLSTRVDAIEQAGGLTPPTLNLYKKISSRLVISQSELNSWNNHIVEIVADLILTGSADFYLPANCIIFMNGGQFVSDNYSGTLNLNEAYIKAEPYQVFGDNISLFGIAKADIAYAEWFGAKGDGEHFDAICFQNACDYVKCNELHLVGGKTYVFERTVYCGDIVLRGCKTTKIMRMPQCIDIPIEGDFSTTTPADADGTVTLTVDTTSSDYSKLAVGVEINLVNRGQWESTRNLTSTGYIIENINGSQVKVRGLSRKHIPNIGNGTLQFSIINAYNLLYCFGKTQLLNVHIDGGMTYFQTALKNGRISWIYSGTINMEGNRTNTDERIYENVIENCLIENSLGDCIEVAGQSTRICHNRIIHSAGNGIVFSRCNHCVVTDNYIFDSNVYLVNGHNEGAISYSNGCYNIVIDSNYFDNCRCGIGSMDTPDNCMSTITNNIFQSFRKDGIEIRLLDAPAWGTRYREIIISNNRFLPTKESEDTIGYEEKYTDSITPLIARQPSATGYAIYIENFSNNNVLEGLIIEGNVIKDSGVRIDATDDAVVSNNIFFVKHNYSVSETHPNKIVYIGCKSTTGNTVVNMVGNTIRNHTDTTITSLIYAEERVFANISNTLYKMLEGCSFITNQNQGATIIELNNNNINI